MSFEAFHPAPQETISVSDLVIVLEPTEFEEQATALRIINTTMNGGYRTSFDKYLTNLVPFAESINRDQAPTFLRDAQDYVNSLRARVEQGHDEALAEDAGRATEFLQANPQAILQLRSGYRYRPATHLDVIRGQHGPAKLIVKSGDHYIANSHTDKLVCSVGDLASPVMRALVRESL